MAIFRRCNRCHDLYQGKNCKRCAALRGKERLERVESARIYGKIRWRNCRRDVRLKWLDYDIWEAGRGNLVKISGRVVVHHILERDEAPELLYDLDNLITCSYDSHADIHAKYREDKAAAIARIRRGMCLFEEMMKVGS